MLLSTTTWYSMMSTACTPTHLRQNERFVSSRFWPVPHKADDPAVVTDVCYYLSLLRLGQLFGMQPSTAGHALLIVLHTAGGPGLPDGEFLSVGSHGAPVTIEKPRVIAISTSDDVS